MVSPNDIVDDLKTALIHKYSIALGRVYDAPDLIIKIPGRPSSPPSSGSTTEAFHGYRRKRGDAVRRELSILESGHHPKRQFPLKSNTDPGDESELILQPDEVVFSILDKFFPDGMRMQNALLVDVREEFTSDDENDYQKRSSSPPFSVTLSSQSLSDMPQLHTSGHHDQPTENEQHYQRSKGLDSSPSHSTNITSVHSRTSRKQALASQNGGPVGGTNLQVASTVSSIQVNHNGLPRPQPQPLQQVNDGSHNTLLSSIEDNSSIRSQSPLRRANHSHSYAVPLSTAAVPSSQSQPQTTNHKSSFQSVTTTSDSERTESQESIQSLQNDGSDTKKTDVSNPDSREDTTAGSHVPLKIKTTTVASRAGKDKPSQTPLSASSLLDGVAPPIKVLIVEDNIINQKILETFMRRRRIRSNVAKNGKEAVEKWREGGYHLVLMDIQLPVLSGIEATKEIRRLERRNRIGVFVDQDTTNIKDEDVLPPHRFKSPVIVVALTASSLDSDRKEALAAGCNDFLTKPVNLVWLERKITEVFTYFPCSLF